MGIFDFFRQLFKSDRDEFSDYTYDKTGTGRRYDKKPVIKEKQKEQVESGLDELLSRLKVSSDILSNIKPAYHEFSIAKRSGGQRKIAAPQPQLHKMQKAILRLLLDKLKTHPNVTGFEKGHSIVTNAIVHVGADVVLRMDIKDFFPSTNAKRIRNYFRSIGWDIIVSDLLARFCTFRGGLPQGAPTSPRLSNLVNYQMDARLAGLADKLGAVYTRYADDLTFSFRSSNMSSGTSMLPQNPRTLERVPYSSNIENNLRFAIAVAIRMTKTILKDYGYQLHQKRKLIIRRKHQRQQVTGLVVNKRVALPRKTRRWLRAVEHRLATGRQATITKEQFDGWNALQHMIATQSQG
jgi:RNA-directed DNA polymerase